MSSMEVDLYFSRCLWTSTT